MLYGCHVLNVVLFFFKFSRISNFWHAGTWETQLLKNGHNLIVFMPILTGAVRASQSLV